MKPGGWVGVWGCLAVTSALAVSFKPDRVAVPAGPFTRGSTLGDLDERPVTTRRLPTFSIDRTEVTRAMYARCVSAKRCSALGVDLSIDPDVPVTQVSWFEAKSFCAYAQLRQLRK